MGTKTGARRAVSAAGLLCASALAAAAQTGAPPHPAKPALPLQAPGKITTPQQATKTAMPQPGKTYTYAILRNGSPIGKHTMSVTSSAGSTTIDEATDIQVKVVFVTAYKMHTASHEVWTGDKFASFNSQSDDNGKQHKVEASVDAKGAVSVTTEAGHNPMPVGTLPSTFWTEQVMTGRKSFFDPETGAPQELVITAVGHEPISLGGQRLETTHYHVAGTIERDVWFANGTPVRFQLKGSDGSTIISDLVPESAVR